MEQKSSISTISDSIQRMVVEDPGSAPRTGLGMPMTAFFLIAQMAGAGFLSLPKALANTGWIGIALMIIFCFMVGFSGTRLGLAWVILEERWPEYRGASRMPYMDIAERSLGKHGRRLALCCVLITIIGGTIVFLLLMAGFFNMGLVPSLSICEWVLILGAVALPFTWLGTPKDFWQASIIAVVATAIACIVIFVEILLEIDDYPDAYYQNPSIVSFSLGFGAILFAFGGASVFPTIQNDMRDRTLFPKSVVIAFISLLSLYLPVAVAGYVVQGVDVQDNILLSVDIDNPVIKAAIVMEILNLFGTYLITFNPIGQTFEGLLKIEDKFGLPRILLRSGIVIFEVIVGLAVPDFGMILNLIGGSTVTLCTFVLPPLMYMKLVDMEKEPSWPERSIPLWERIVLWEIIIVGVIGGIASTASAVMGIVTQSFGNTCFNHFYG
ncbi:uncharacterized protein [Palaemon carinicauda]|uniref:uncharacterized protein isoform X1 n=2 Tax=Palaemon carinicauda TaxID=392227 RepID=UPI0035B6949E